jgi:poly(ADP-ribose) glycohydrolase ARH3
MVIAVAESLVQRSTVDPAHLLGRFEARYEPARGFGRGMKLALDAFRRGLPWQECAFVAWPEGSRGNGGAVRVVAIAVASWADGDARRRAAEVATRTTHAHGDAIAMAILQTAALALVADEPHLVTEPASFLARLLGATGGAGAAATVLDRVADLLAARAPAAEVARALGTSTLATDSVPAALWAFLAHLGSYEDAVTGAAVLGGDVDSICCMAGALAGAYHGEAGIPARWLENLQGDDPGPAEILDLADRVAALAPLTVPAAIMPLCAG